MDCGDLDLAATLESGQVFHWQRDGNDPGALYHGCLGDEPASLWQPAPGRLLVNAEAAAPARRFLRLDDSHESALATFPANDAILTEALTRCPGLRILRQPLWECLATFITSSMKQVAHIRAISLHLRRAYGVRQLRAGRELWSYPSPERLAEAGEPALRAAGLGYRAGYLHETAKRFAEGRATLDEPLPLGDDEARQWLLRFPGVGEKVANCVLLFGCDRIAAFPIDVWIERFLRERYFPPRPGRRRQPKPPSVKQLQAWAAKHFGPAAGYAQQYLFHYARVHRGTSIQAETDAKTPDR